MSEIQNEKPRYGTWIRTRNIVRFWLITLALLLAAVAAAILAALWLPALFALAGLALAAAGLFGYVAAVISLSAWRFSPAGGDWQALIHNLILERLAPALAGHPSLPALDIGCGSGHLVIKAALAWPGTAFQGLDYWGDEWEYSAEQCQINARLEGRPEIKFQRGSAAELPFADDSFAAVFSCLTFHEVAGLADRTQCLGEALRVLAPGGRFVFFDLFDDPTFYPAQERIAQAISAAGGQIEESRPLAELHSLPWPVSGRKALGYGRLIAGRLAV